MSIGRICGNCGEIYQGKACTCRADSPTLRRRVYDSRTWRRHTRRAVFARDNDTCQHCGAPGYVVDHVIPIELMHQLNLDPLDPDECQLLCSTCSNTKDTPGNGTITVQAAIQARDNHRERLGLTPAAPMR